MDLKESFAKHFQGEAMQHIIASWANYLQGSIERGMLFSLRILLGVGQACSVVGKPCPEDGKHAL